MYGAASSLDFEAHSTYTASSLPTQYPSCLLLHPFHGNDPLVFSPTDFLPHHAIQHYHKPLASYATPILFSAPLTSAVMALFL